MNVFVPRKKNYEEILDEDEDDDNGLPMQGCVMRDRENFPRVDIQRLLDSASQLQIQ